MSSSVRSVVDVLDWDFNPDTPRKRMWISEISLRYLRVLNAYLKTLLPQFSLHFARRDSTLHDLPRPCASGGAHACVEFSGGVELFLRVS